MARSTRAGVAIVAFLSSCFIPLDYAVFPETFAWMLSFRLFCNFVMGVIYFRTARTHPMASAVAGCLVVGFMLLFVIAAAGGVTSDYSPGLMLLFLGMPVLLPFSAPQAALIVAVLLAGLGGLPLVSGEAPTLQAYFSHMIFPTAAGVESIFACSLLDRLRFSDYYQRRELERARDDLKQLDIEKSRFTANVHHELRTPLTLMLAPLEAMLGGEFGDVSSLQRGYLQTMHTNAIRLFKLINDLLDLARIEGRQLTIKRRPTRLQDLVEQLVAGARPLAERKKIELSSHGLDHLREINVDAEAIDKIVVNLLGNALKFTDEGGAIEISGELMGDGGIHLVVSDTGIGLAKDQLERIFNRFAQVDTSATRRHEGTGIGLALVKELVELHQGRIWAESAGLGQGTQMHVVLPVGAADHDRDEEVLRTDDGRAVALGTSIAAMEGELDIGGSSEEALRFTDLQQTVERSKFDFLESDQRDPVAPAPAGAPEVLICEDNADMRRLLSFLLGQEFRVRLARNGREALEAVHASAPELILTDVMMPEMSGTELCRAIKEDPETQGIPVVLITSKAEREMKIEGLELGADDYVTKPFHSRELMARIRSLVRLRKLQEELAVRNTLLESTNEELQATLAELREAGVQLAQAERLAAVGELAAGIAHEINNPMNFATNALKALRGYVEDIRAVTARIAEIDWRDRDALDAQLRELAKLKERLEFDDAIDSLAELVDIVTEGLERTHRLVGDLRDFASPGDGELARVDLLRGLHTTVKLVGHRMHEAGVELRLDAPEALPPVEGDPRALNQVFLNILKNAAEALDGRGGTVSITARSEGGSVVVRVRDDGPGIAAELRSKIFEPFYSTKGPRRGSGLGLSISNRIVVEHGGTIEVSSEPGEGTTFTVTIPVRGGNRAA